MTARWKLDSVARVLNSTILNTLRSFVSRTSIDLAPSAGDLPEASAYAPIKKYVLDLAHHTKPETASEHLFREVAKDALGVSVFSQVNIGDGFVDFIIPEVNGAVLLELKPLFQVHSETELRRYELKPKQHLAQIRKYLHRHEYVVLTDLKEAYLFSARDTLVDGSFFAVLPFADLLARYGESRSLLDVMRRTEDAVEKPELDRQFFEDLKEWFHVFEKVAFTPPEDAAELNILLINKLVFAKTLEDHGLVPYRFIQDEYEKQKDRWEAKGSRHTLRGFLRNFEEFFDDYYDTELFARKIWDHVEQTPENLDRFARALELVLGVSKWDKVFSRGIVHYNYRKINEDIFGKSYEMFLASNRKDEGIYYTPAPITTPMADSLVDSLFAPLVDEICALIHKDRCDFVAAGILMEQLSGLRIADTAAGSGGFLIKVLRAIWRHYLRIDQAGVWVRKMGDDLFDMPPNVQQAAEFRRRHAFDARRVLIARLLLQHIYAIDKDGGAIEVAKTNIWKEAVKLSVDDYNYRQLKAESGNILPNLELNFICADSLVDVEAALQVEYLREYSQHAVQELWKLRQEYIENPSDHSPLDEALALRAKLDANMEEHFQNENLPAAPAFLALQFFPCYFDATGTPRATGGFDGIIGNPPWEAVKPVRKEFAKIDKYSMSVVDFDAWFAKKLDEDAGFKTRWDDYQRSYETYKAYLSRRFEHQGTGDWNLFKLFIENNLRLLRAGGRLSLLVPSSIQTDEGCGALRRLFITEHTLEELTSFENRGYLKVEDGKESTAFIFPDVDNRFKFGFFKLIKGLPPKPDHAVSARFYLRDPARVFDPPIQYSVEMIKRFSPQNYSFMEFRSEADYQLYTKVRSNHPLLEALGYRFRRELHSADDRRFFNKRDGKKLQDGQMTLYEGKMIFQYNPRYSPSNSFVVEKDVRVECLRKELYRLAQFVRKSEVTVLEGQPIPKKKDELEKRLLELFQAKEFKLQYECERLAYRQVGRSTDERTFIAAILPAQVAIIDTLMYLNPYRYHLAEDGILEQRFYPAAETDSLLGLFNSLILNYYLRSKVSAHVNIFHVYELPIPSLDAKQREWLAKSAAKLSKKPDDFAERAKLEVFIARELYGLSREDWSHLTGTFTFGGDSDSKADLDEIIRLSTAHWQESGCGGE